MPEAKCPNCEYEVHVLANTYPGDEVTCKGCDIDLVVAGTDPIELELDDLDDDDDDDDEF